MDDRNEWIDKKRVSRTFLTVSQLLSQSFCVECTDIFPSFAFLQSKNFQASSRRRYVNGIGRSTHGNRFFGYRQHHLRFETETPKYTHHGSITQEKAGEESVETTKTTTKPRQFVHFCHLSCKYYNPRSLVRHDVVATTPMAACAVGLLGQLIPGCKRDNTSIIH